MMFQRALSGLLRSSGRLVFLAASILVAGAADVEVQPPPFHGGLRNPLMGLTGRTLNVPEWATLTHDYIAWNQLAPAGAADVDHVRDFFRERWKHLPAKNVKVIPRIFLDFPNRAQQGWPSDMQEGDFSSPAFQQRFAQLVSVLGRVWDDDPAVAFVELGIFGKWGEHHSPDPTPELQGLATRAFVQAFWQKLVSVRHAWAEFPGGRFGVYWDSFGHHDQMATHGRGISEMNQRDGRYLTTYIGGEVAYDWGNFAIEPGASPTATLRVPSHREHMINTIRWLHTTQLRWIADYDVDDAEARRGADLVQTALGYRFEITRARFTATLPAEGELRLSMWIRNQGSAPFYYRWPVQVALLSRVDLKPVWQTTWDSVDVRKWAPGEQWPEPPWHQAPDGGLRGGSADGRWDPAWTRPAPSMKEIGLFRPDVPPGQYVLAVALCDPAGLVPAVHLANRIHLPGGWHALGLVGVGGATGGPLPPEFPVVDPFLDRLHYVR